MWLYHTTACRLNLSALFFIHTRTRSIEWISQNQSGHSWILLNVPSLTDPVWMLRFYTCISLNVLLLLNMQSAHTKCDSTSIYASGIPVLLFIFPWKQVFVSIFIPLSRICTFLHVISITTFVYTSIHSLFVLWNHNVSHSLLYNKATLLSNNGYTMWIKWWTSQNLLYSS